MCALYRFPDGDKESDGPSESGDNTSESTQTNSEAGTGCAQERGKVPMILVNMSYLAHVSVQMSSTCVIRFSY